MTEQATPALPAPTGVGAVDAVVEAVSALEGRPLEEHVAAFESAHEQLRRSLDAAPESS